MIDRIWVFAVAPSDSDRRLFVQRVEWLNVTDVVLFVNNYQACKFQLTSNVETRIRNTAEELGGIGVDTHLISWLRPIRTYMTDCADRLRPLCQRIGARSLLFDAEEPWTKNSCGKSGEAWARELMANHWPFANWPSQLGVTGITYIPNSVKPLAERCHYTLPQAYSINKANKVYRPGETQVEAHRRWREFRYPWIPFARKKMVMGLAAWNLNRHGGLSRTQAMQTALSTVEGLSDPSVTEVAYWSMSWITKSSEIAEFIRNSGLKAKQGVPQSSELLLNEFVNTW
jgi:hypothetical protein